PGPAAPRPPAPRRAPAPRARPPPRPRPAALELAEQGTRIADAAGGVPDEVWANAAKHYDSEELVALVATIAAINAFNRLNVIFQQPAGDYQPGQFA
ncbi:carboxymuconolactone decarboxylase family protein, partial [Streptomyces sp. NPDC059627]